MREYIVLAIPSSDIAEVKAVMDAWPITDVYEQVIDLDNPVYTKDGTDFHVVCLDAERIDKKYIENLTTWLANKKITKLGKADMVEITDKPSAKLKIEGYKVFITTEVIKNGK